MVTVRTWRGRKRLGAKQFTCANGSSAVEVRFSGRAARKLGRRSKWVLHAALAVGGVTRAYRVVAYNPRPARASEGQFARASDGQYWTQAYGRCGVLAGGQFLYQIDPPPIASPSGDIGRVRYYWYRYGVGWVGDTGWQTPFTIPPGPGGVFLGPGAGYILKADSGAWYAGVIAVNWQYANETQWNWVFAHSENVFNPNDPSNTWCSAG
jgi:hypothetical protein